jgi:hypothetical protein
VRRARAAWFALALLAGCSSYKAPAALDPADPALARFDLVDSALRVSVVPLAAKEPAKKFLGVDPVELAAVPLMIEVENLTGAPLKLVPSSLRLRVAGGGAFEPIDIDEAFIRAQRAGMGDMLGAGVGGALLLGPAGAIVGVIAGASHTDTVNRTASDDYLAKRFHPWLLEPSGKASGVVFFGGAPQELLALTFTLREIESGAERELRVPLSTRGAP